MLRKAGLEIEGMVSIFNYGFNVSDKAFEEAGVKYQSLTNYSTLINIALEKEIVNPETEAILLNWREDPANWKGL